MAEYLSGESSCSENEIRDESGSSDMSQSFSHVHAVIGNHKKVRRTSQTERTGKSVGAPATPDMPPPFRSSPSTATIAPTGKGNYRVPSDCGNEPPFYWINQTTSGRKRKILAASPINRSQPIEDESDDEMWTSTPRSQPYLREQRDNKLVMDAIKKLDKKVSQLQDSHQKAATAQAQILKNQEEILKKLSAYASHSVGGQLKKVDVPGFIRTAVKDGYTSGIRRGLLWSVRADGLNDYLKPQSTPNVEMTEFINTYVEGLYPSSEPGVRKAAIERYFESCRQKQLRQSKGQDVAHKTKMALYERKKRKRDRRVQAVKLKKSWSQDKKDKVTKSLKLDYMSSEYEHDSGGETFFEVKPLLWRTEEFIRTISELDNKSLQNQSARSKRQQIRRMVGEPSNRPAPENLTDGDDWVVKSSNN